MSMKGENVWGQRREHKETSVCSRGKSRYNGDRGHGLIAMPCVTFCHPSDYGLHTLSAVWLERQDAWAQMSRKSVEQSALLILET